MNKYTEVEILDNDDKYYAEGYGKQTAKKGIKFQQFPNVLIIQLKRFEYNPKKDVMVKINDCFEFYETIDLSKYMDNSNTESENLYSLHSIVVHQGSANSGHYYAYIKPTTSNHWILYNDEIVRPADAYEALNSNYGGTYTTFRHKGRGEIVQTSKYFESNAYVLVYIKTSERTKILSPVYEFDVYIILNLIRSHQV